MKLPDYLFIIAMSLDIAGFVWWCKWVERDMNKKDK